MKLVYIAGPFSAPDRAGVELNIRNAERFAISVAEAGGMPVCPHANTSHPRFEEVQPYQFWIAGTLRLLEVCDAVMLVPGWELSRGATGEKRRAEELGIPVFAFIAPMKLWLEKHK